MLASRLFSLSDGHVALPLAGAAKVYNTLPGDRCGSADAPAGMRKIAQTISCFDLKALDAQGCCLVCPMGNPFQVDHQSMKAP